MTIYYAIRRGRKIGVFRSQRYAQILTRNFTGCQMRKFNCYRDAFAYAHFKHFYVVYCGRSTGVFSSYLSVLILTLGYPNALVKEYSDAELAYQDYQAAFCKRVFYAVRKGLKPGIYTDNKLADKQVKHVASEMKKFDRLVDAKRYMLGMNNNVLNIRNYYRLKHSKVKLIGNIAPIDLTVLGRTTTVSQSEVKQPTKASVTQQVAKKQVYYAVKIGRQSGIYTNHETALEQVLGYPNYKMRKFKKRADAEQYVSDKSVLRKKEGSYFAVRTNEASSKIFLDSKLACQYAKQYHGMYVIFTNLQDATKFISVYNTQFINDGEANITVYTDGGFEFHTNYGSWAYLIKNGNFTQYDNGFITSGQDNHQMELMAVKEALLALKRQGLQKQHVQFFLDSQTAITNICSFAIKQEAIIKTCNIDLIKEINQLLAEFPHVYFDWVKGHASNEGNCFVDQKASKALAQIHKAAMNTVLV